MIIFFSILLLNGLICLGAAAARVHHFDGGHHEDSL